MGKDFFDVRIYNVFLRKFHFDEVNILIFFTGVALISEDFALLFFVLLYRFGSYGTQCDKLTDSGFGNKHVYC